MKDQVPLSEFFITPGQSVLSLINQIFMMENTKKEFYILINGE